MYINIKKSINKEKNSPLKQRKGFGFSGQRQKNNDSTSVIRLINFNFNTGDSNNPNQDSSNPTSTETTAGQDVPQATKGESDSSEQQSGQPSQTPESQTSGSNMSQVGKNLWFLPQDKTTKLFCPPEDFAVNTEGRFFSLVEEYQQQDPRYIKKYNYSGNARNPFVPPSVGSPSNLLPVASNKLIQDIVFVERNIFKFSLETFNLEEGNQKRRQTVTYWVQVNSNRNIRIQVGQLIEKLFELVGFSLAAMISNQIVFKRVTLMGYAVSGQSSNETDIDLNDLNYRFKYSFPMNVRGFITDVPPNERGLDFELYLEGQSGNRFNRFTLTGVAAKDSNIFYSDGTFLSNVRVYINKLFINTHTIDLPARTGSGSRSLTVKLFDVINSDSKLSPVVGCSFGGFKRLASSNLKDKIAKLNPAPTTIEVNTENKKVLPPADDQNSS